MKRHIAQIIFFGHASWDPKSIQKLCYKRDKTLMGVRPLRVRKIIDIVMWSCDILCKVLDFWPPGGWHMAKTIGCLYHAFSEYGNLADQDFLKCRGTIPPNVLAHWSEGRV